MRIEEIREPFIKASIVTPKEYIGQVMELCQERRGDHAGMHFLSAERVQLTYDLPLAEIVLDFFDQLKSRTRGYASLDYEIIGMRAGRAGQARRAAGRRRRRRALDARPQGQGLRARAHAGREAARQDPAPAVRRAHPGRVGAHIIARETVKAFRKDVIAKCYGGDISRKRKLLEKQKEGKRRMKQVGRIEVPQEAFLAVLELGDSS